jgi:hypothetical protein
MLKLIGDTVHHLDPRATGAPKGSSLACQSISGVDPAGICLKAGECHTKMVQRADQKQGRLDVRVRFEVALGEEP